MGDLAGRLEAAEEGTRILDFEFLEAIEAKWDKGMNTWVLKDKEYPYRASGFMPTRNLQDADDCIEDGVEYEISNLYGVARAEVGLNFADRESGRGEHKGGDLRLALCAAIVRAALKARRDAGE